MALSTLVLLKNEKIITKNASHQKDGIVRDERKTLNREKWEKEKTKNMRKVKQQQ